MDIYLSLLIGLIALFAAWNSWKDVNAEIARDKLFDLRDEWRVFWSKTGRSFDEPIYGQVRQRLNQHLRYTKKFRFVGLLYCIFRFKKVLRIGRSIPVLAFPLDSRIDKEVKSISNRAIDAIRDYMLLSSLFLFPVLAGACVYLIVKRTWAVKRALEKSVRKVSALPLLDRGLNRRVIEFSSFSNDMATSGLTIA